MDNILKAFEKCIASIVTAERRDQGNLQSVPPPSGRRPRSRTAAGTETEHNDDHDDCSARLPGAAPASDGTDRPRTGLSGCRVGAGRCPAHFHLHLRFTRCAAPPSPAALTTSSGEQHAEYLSARRPRCTRRWPMRRTLHPYRRSRPSQERSAQDSCKPHDTVRCSQPSCDTHTLRHENPSAAMYK